MRRYFHQKSNRWDSCRQILLVEKREEVLDDFSRRKRPYDKRDTNYWFEGGKSAIAKKIVKEMCGTKTGPQPEQNI